MKTERWLPEWVMSFTQPLPDRLWTDYSIDELDLLVWGLLPYLKGMTEELLGNNIFQGGDDDVRKKKQDEEPTKFLLLPGKRIENNVVLPTREYLEQVGLSYIHRGVFFTLLLYRYVFIEEDSSPKIGKLSEAATRGLAIGIDLVRRMRDGTDQLPSDRYLRLQRVPRIEFGAIDLDKLTASTKK
jgi:hypothetical protein